MKERTPVISVIVPFHNAEEYLENAIRSVLRQTFREFELILVNDGSTDESQSVCAKLAREDDRILLLEQKESLGVSAERNRGMEAARGKYIAFLDADDEYVPTALDYLYGMAEAEHADVVHTPGFYEEMGGNRYEKEYRVGGDFPEGVALPQNLGERLELYLASHISRSIWNKLYRRDFLASHGIQFEQIATSEDILFSLQCLCLADRYVMGQELVYLYWHRMSSVTNTLGMESLRKILKSLFSGLSWQDKFMDGIPFFSVYPEYRHRVQRLYLECTFNWGIRQMYPQGISDEESYRAVCEAAKEYVGEERKWVAALLREYASGKSLGKPMESEKNQGYPYTFSIIMSVYNVEPWIREAVASVLNQDIGFSDHVQIILVDDGSTDASGKICDEYALCYPNNIQVIHKANGGLGSARNEGLKYVTGQYVNFLDPDDKLSLNALREVKKFFDAHEKDGIDLVAIPLYLFEGQTGGHVLNYKFAKGSRIIDLTKEPECLHNSGAASFIRLEIAKRMKFDIRLINNEDTDVLMKYFMKNPRYGVVTTARYHYRKRREGSSRVQVSAKSRENYTSALEYYHYKCIEYAKKHFETIPPFVQFAIMYDIQWRIQEREENVRKVLSQEELENYRERLYGLLQYIDDDIICQQKHIWVEHFFFLFLKKYHVRPELQRQGEDFVPMVAGRAFSPLSKYKTCLEFLRVEEDCLVLEGFASFLGVPEDMEVSVYLQVNGEKFIACEIEQERKADKECLGEWIFPSLTFCGRVENLSSYGELECRIFLKVDSVMIERKDLRFREFFPIGREFRESYAVVGNWILRAKGNCLCLSPATEEAREERERRFIKELEGRKEEAAKEAIFYRNACHAMRPLIKEEIWLISDRINKADDNGEALFRYLKDHHAKEQTYFILRRDSADYERLREYGEILEYQSRRHKLMHLLADKIISSAAEGYIRNPFGGNRKYYRDILHGKKVIFLQHGITMNDVTDWLNRYSQNFSLIMTCARREQEAFLEGAYFYDSRVVKLTGFPRYDALEDHAKRQITIMPTWRQYLTKNVNYVSTGLQSYSRSFQESDYFKFYNALLNHEKLLEAAKTCGYTIHFMPHPNLLPELDAFDRAPEVEFHAIDTSYKKIFSESSLVVTDYSSVAFDFAYLRKPVLYCQFDRETFFHEHLVRKGYFSYEEDGFGEVVYDLEGTVEKIIEYMRNECVMKEMYRKRVENFFAFHDRENCKRVYEAIQEI